MVEEVLDSNSTGDGAEQGAISGEVAKTLISRQWSPGRLRVRAKKLTDSMAVAKPPNGASATKAEKVGDRISTRPAKRRASSPPKESTSSTKDSDDGGPTVCDECFPPGTRCRDNELKGWRWKCAMCSDYDLCTSCVMRTKHDCTHVFVSSVPPGGQEVPQYLCGMPSLHCTAQPGSAHENVSCRACDGQVVGLRFKCAVCENYDLCECCFRAGQPEDLQKLESHNDQMHAWFLIRAPIKKPETNSRFGSLWPYMPSKALNSSRPVGRPRKSINQQKPMTRRNRSRQSNPSKEVAQGPGRPRMKLRAIESTKPRTKVAPRVTPPAGVKSEPKSNGPRAAKRLVLDRPRSNTRANNQRASEAGGIQKKRWRGAVRQPGTVGETKVRKGPP